MSRREPQLLSAAPAHAPGAGPERHGLVLAREPHDVDRAGHERDVDVRGASDDRDLVRFRVSFLYRGRLAMWVDFGLTQLSWEQRLVFYTTKPLPRRLRPGRWVACVTAWD